MISHALQHPLDLDSAISREHPTPYIQPPPSSKDIKQEDFDINPEEFKTDQTRYIKVLGQLAPGKLLPSQKKILVSIPYPLDPVKGHPPAKKDSIGARHFKKGFVPPPSEAELVETVKNLPVRRIMQKPAVKSAKVSDKEKHSRIMQKSWQEEHPQIVIDVDKEDVIDVDKQQSSSSKPSDAWITQNPVIIEEDDDEEEEEQQQQSLISSETVEEITIEILDDEEEEKKAAMVKEKLKSLKRKLIPSENLQESKFTNWIYQRVWKQHCPQNSKLLLSH